MKDVAKSFAVFLAFTIALNLVVRPLAKQANVPLLKDI